MNKNICFFINDISSTGGTERITSWIANYLVENGYHITILSYRNGEVSHFKCNDKVKLDSLHLENSNGFIERKIKPYIEVKKFFSNNHFDIIINVDVILCLYTLPLKKMLNAKIIAWEHFNYRSNNGVKNRSRARKLAGSLADGIIVLTQTDKEEYSKNLNLHCPIFVINNPVEKNNHMKLNENKEKIVIAVGRLTYQKNIQEMITIWNSLGVETSEWKLQIVGSGEEKEILERMITELNIKNVEFMGFTNNPEDYYQKAKVILMTSRYEGMPMVLLEAQSAGLPIISYDCFTGPSEIIIDKRNGFLIPYGDKEVFAKKLFELINNEQLINEFSENSSVDSQRFSIDKIGEKWIEFLGKV